MKPFLKLFIILWELNHLEWQLIMLIIVKIQVSGKNDMLLNTYLRLK